MDAPTWSNSTRLVPHPDAKNPVLTASDVDDALAKFVADPFLVFDGQQYHMFFEIKCHGGRVFIGHAYSNDGLEYTYNGIVLQPDVAEHTYPHVFPMDGEWLMVPSPGANVDGQARIYVADEFPTEWSLADVPLNRGVRLDPTPIYSDGTWFLLYQEADSYDVRLVVADSLIGGEWEEHPASPIFRPGRDAVTASSIGHAEMVPSGRPIYTADGIELFYRSHCDRTVYRYQITELTRSTFTQRECPDSPALDHTMNQGWNERFMHTINPVYPWEPAGDVVAVDGLEAERYRYRIGIYTVE